MTGARKRLVPLGLAACVATAACWPQAYRAPSPKPGLLSVYTDSVGFGLMELRRREIGTEVYRLTGFGPSGGHGMEKIVVSDPRYPYVDFIYTGPACDDSDCDGFVLKDCYGYFQPRNFVESVSLLGCSQLPGAVILVSGTAQIGTRGLAPLPGDFLVAGSGGSIDGFRDELEILQAATDGSTAPIVARVPAIVRSVRTVGSRIYTTDSSNHLSAYDASDPFAPSLLGTVALATSGGWPVMADYKTFRRPIAVLGTNVVAVSWVPDMLTYPCRLNRFVVDSAFSSAAFAGSGDDDMGGCPGVQLVPGGFAIVGVSYSASDTATSKPRVEAFRLEPGGGLVRVGRIDLPAKNGRVLDVVVDTARNLVFATQPDSFDVIDLGYLTTGTAAWPAPY